MRNSALCVLVLTMLAGCNQSNVQARYNDSRTECRAFAEEKQSRIGSKGNVAIRNAELVTLFSDCMAKAGWQVATPRREGSGGATRGGGLPGVSTPASVGAAVGASVGAAAGTNIGERAAIANANRGTQPVAPAQAAPQPVAPVPQQAQAVQPQRVAPQRAQPQQTYAPQQQPSPYLQPAQPSGGPVFRQIPEENYF